ncbi:coproporphyrinogen dehydrogenase HemZ [Aristaeella hokkaidonensis]|uniref:Coproporphyrinogen dehydrogenase HemZ n=1 Tax=Aristaeella hokkaidonensis TaxID=3046382 RepID=A0AC61MW81_9FIRM|nr:coproporphyrinogen dehydrogenase HemZ [Aristaeella hokkaidonensis]QUC66772.1 coproporphyrinogen dehydrogenase HemZ [Aristaeella hokkaidonensis]SNT94749.1 oxygen-independent coproporphyrinogen-3 oxidase [Aristaeella hokkaidonensis]
MTEIESYLETIEPELRVLTRIFGFPESVWDEPRKFIPLSEEKEGQFTIAFAADGHRVERSTQAPEDADERIRTLHRRRAARRLCKQTLYDLLKEMTGIQPPWGSLTGVRPTHLMLEALEEGLTPEAAIGRLTADFDVAPDRAALLAEIAAEQRKLPKPGDEWMDVYIGIPFCTTRCAYCSFSSGEIGDGSLIEPYMASLTREMRACAEILKDSGRKLRALYVGGGTPTALPQGAFEQLMEETVRCFPGAMEYTVEAGRPDTLTREKLRAIRNAGIGRISINPQTMNDRTLEIIGRAHTAQQVREAYALAREEAIPHINMDVIAGLPGENEADFAHTMEEARKLRPESLTVHTLAIKRSSRMSLENHPLPDGNMTACMVETGRETARAMGMAPYYLYKQKYMAGNLENTGYALPGHACLYNVDIMEETSHILAMGAGGISKRIFPEEGHIERAPNVSNIHDYLTRTEEMIKRKRELFLNEN